MEPLEIIDKNTLINGKNIEDCIHFIRGYYVMLDTDVAYFFNVDVRRINEQMKRNKKRFPEDFCFQLNSYEFHSLISQNATSKSGKGGKRKLPYVYTEQGIMALSGVIKNDFAVEMSIKIVRTFVEMKNFIQENGDILLKLAQLQNKQVVFEIETNKKFDEMLKLINKSDIPKEAIFFDGQFYDACEFIIDIIIKANRLIILIDPYCDSKVFLYLKNKKEKVKTIIYKSSKSRLKDEDIKQFEKQYTGETEIQTIDSYHDRFLIIDEKECWSLGTSLNYVGKKAFAINKIEEEENTKSILNKLDNRVT